MFTPKLVLVALAIFLIIAYLPALAAPKRFRKEMKDFTSDTATVRMLGLFVMLIAFFFLSVQYKFEDGWMMLIAIFGWIALAKSILFLWNPEFVKRFARKSYFYSSNTGITALAIIAIVAAVAMIYLALEVVNAVEVVAG